MLGGLIGGVVGAGIGFLVGGPEGAMLGWSLGSAVGNLLDPPKVYQPLQDLRVQSSDYGKPIPINAGTIRAAGNIIWAPDIIERNQKVGGKGGGGKQQQAFYYGSAAIAICEGPILGVKRVWADGKILYDNSGASAFSTPDGSISATPAASLDFSGQAHSTQQFVQAIISANNPPHINPEGSFTLNANVKFYFGTEYQNPDPTIQAHLGAANTPAYRGTAYALLNEFPLEHFGNRIPNFEFEVISDGFFFGRSSDGTLSGIATVAFNESNQTFNYVSYGQFNFYNLTNGQHVILSNSYAATANGLAINQATNEVYLAVVDRTSDPVNPYRPVILVYDGSSYAVKRTIAGFAVPTLAAARLDALAFDPVRNNLWAFSSADPNYNGYAKINLASNNYSLFTLQAGLNDYQITPGGAYQSCAYEGFTDQILLSYKRPDNTYAVSSFNPVTGAYQGDEASIGVYNTPINLSLNPASNALWYCNGEGVFKRSTKTAEFRGVAFPFIPSAVMFLSNGDLWLGAVSGNDIVYAPFDAAGEFILSPYAPYPCECYPTVSKIIMRAAKRAGLTEDDFDKDWLGQASEIIQGYTLRGNESARQAIENLLVATATDLVESDGVLRIRRRADAPLAATIAYEEFLAEQKGQPVITESRQLETELPRRIDMHYMDPSVEYRVNIAHAQRTQTSSVDFQEIQLPLVLSQQRAQVLADTYLATRWVQRVNYQFSTTNKYAYLDVGDVVSIETENGYQSVILTKMQLSATGRIKFGAIATDPSMYGALGSTAAYAPVNAQIITPFLPPTYQLLDCPIAQDSDSVSGFYVAAYATDPASAWRGATLWREKPTDQYSKLIEIPSEATAGVTTTAVPACDYPQVPQQTESFTVRINSVSNNIYSATWDDVFNNGSNLALVGKELIRFQEATHNTDGTVTLTGLLRGQHGTEQYVNTHAVGESFVLMDSAVVRVPLDASETFKTYNYKCAQTGASIVSIPPTPFTNTNAGLAPLSPVEFSQHNTFVANVAPTDAQGALLSWVRRGRVSADLRDNMDVPLGETTEQYMLTVALDDGTVVDKVQVVPNPALTGIPAGSVGFWYTLGLAEANIPAQYWQTYTNYSGASVSAPPKYLNFTVAQVSDAIGPGAPSASLRCQIHNLN